MPPPLRCLVEIPKGSRNEYEWGRLGEDGDPLDAMVRVSARTFPGCAIPVARCLEERG